jgi:hypothetical protein
MLNWLKRTWSLLVPILLVVLIIDWAAVVTALVTLSVIALAMFLLDALFDSREKWGLFPDLNMNFVLDKASSNPISAAMVWLGWVALAITVILSVVYTTSAHATTLPAGYVRNQPVLKQVIATHWPNSPMPHIIPGQVEQESSWKERATLHTSRELGRGLVQLTIAYTQNGAERFNAYRDATGYAALRSWDWRNDPYNVRYQLTYLVLRDRATFNQTRLMMADDAEAWRAALVAYNAGMGRVLQRRKNAVLMGLDKSRWAGGLDQAHGQAENILIYGRPLWQAVNEYPVVVFKKATKYA